MASPFQLNVKAVAAVAAVVVSLEPLAVIVIATWATSETLKLRWKGTAVCEALHPGVSLDTLVSIYSQESSRLIRFSHGRHVRGIEAHARRYLAPEDVFAAGPYTSHSSPFSPQLEPHSS